MTAGELYPVLKDRARTIVTGFFRGYPIHTVMELSHDITVDFLFFSECFQKFDESKGSMNDLFSAYVRRKCLSCFRVGRPKWEVLVKAFDLFPDEKTTRFTNRFEIRWTLRTLLSRLEGMSYLGVSAEDVFLSMLDEIMENGAYSVRSICHSLGTSNRRKVSDLVEYIKGELDGCGEFVSV
jgi:hypothetical protein